MLTSGEIINNTPTLPPSTYRLSNDKMDNLQTFSEQQRRQNMNIIPRTGNSEGNLGIRRVQGHEIGPRVNGATEMTHQNIVDLVNINNNNVWSPREVGLILRAIGDDLNLRAFVRHNPTG